MILAIDIGNSNIVLGAYKNHSICFLSRIATNRYLESDQYAVELHGILSLYNVSAEEIAGIAISSVVPMLTPVLVRALEHLFAKKPHILSLQDAGEIFVDIENPAEIGMDILASAIAVQKKHSLPAIIIDMGTATKFTAIDANKHLRGVAISPGLFLSLDALVSGTSTLRGVSLDAPQNAVGRNTTESMKSGIVLGAASMIDGMIERFENELGAKTAVIATGGAAPSIVPHCKRNILYSETLILEGLCVAYLASAN